MHAQIVKLAQASQNFGFLLEHEPLLVLFGVSAESYIYPDPNTSLMKARQFAETLAARMVAETETRVRGDRQVDRLAALARSGLLDSRIKRAFDAVRRAGNEAVHGYFGEVRVALAMVGHCFELGVWFHRFLTEDRSVIAFVPPAPPESGTAASSAVDADELRQLREELAAYRDRLAQTKVRLDGRLDELAAEQAARTEAEQAAERARSEAQALHETVAELHRRISALVADSPRQTTLTPATVATESADADAMAVREVLSVEAGIGLPGMQPRSTNADQREALIERARVAAREPRTEVQVRAEIDRMLQAAGWVVQNVSALNLFVGGGGVAVREGRTASGPADYLLYVDQALVGVIEAKREGTTLTQVEGQSARYAGTLTKEQQMATWRSPLPFRYESTAIETQFTNVLDPVPRSRRVFSFHQPATLARWMREADEDPDHPTLRARLAALPATFPLATASLRPAQVDAVTGLERSLATGRPRALIQMATGAGKTYAAVTTSARLLRHARARRVLFLVDRNNLGRQARTEFGGYMVPDDGRRFTDLYNAEILAGSGVADSWQVVISTVQRLYAVLSGRSVPDADTDDPDLDDGMEASGDEDVEPAAVTYSAALPPETFDLIIIDECHRSIYGKWRAVLEYFDAFQTGLTATPTKQTLGYFQRNVVSEYSNQQAVADGVNVDFDVYRIRTKHGEQGDTIEAGITVPRRDRRTREQRYEELDDDFSYSPDQLGRTVISEGNLDLVLATFRDRLFTEIFPGRTEVPKTLVFARDDNHADEIVRRIREVFNRGNEFAVKITYSVRNTDELLASFRNSAELRVAVTVDMISTGTDVRPLECLLFLRNPKSPVAFEQMKGRGARTIDPAEFQSVTPDARTKDRFVLVDAIGVVDTKRVDAAPLARHTERQISLEALLRKAGSLEITADETATLASRLARLDQRLTAEERTELETLAKMPLAEVVGSLVRAADPDLLADAERKGPTEVRKLVVAAVRPLAANPDLRARLLEIRRAHEITIDEVNTDVLLSAGGVDRSELARDQVTSWRAYLKANHDEIALIEAAYEHGGDPRSVYIRLKELAARIARPPHLWSPLSLWHSYQVLGLAPEAPGVSYGTLDLIGLIRYELGIEEQPRPHRAVVDERFASWLAAQRQAGVTFTADQEWWLERIKDIVVSSATFNDSDLDESPFTQNGGTDGFLAAFGNDRAETVLTTLRTALTA
ncbi:MULTISPECIES: DEAD/DEAH box helicase family protein [Frankia]|uniref:DEAD/DEAH box helicase family protein n=1 Tax=Frankia TaxID=1854 RepID=UPI0009E39C3E|nr:MULTISPECIES: DEAD/DEAH box helicase family protein [Frankia]